MKKNQKHEDHQELDIELLKAVAQAWHGHLSSSKSNGTTSEFDAHKRFFKGRPTRFKLEAISRASRKQDQCNASWDFGQSLWDSYEIVTVSKKLERGLMLDSPFSALGEGEFVVKKRKESKNSLGSLLRFSSSKRFTEVD